LALAGAGEQVLYLLGSKALVHFQQHVDGILQRLLAAFAVGDPAL
jgi:hypothetical protein